ncbi:MAG: D-alanine--D-alanine ligase [Bacteroidales bacterium]|jgi:D-alanine-D-alanine ligase|nr:D-alanine--D-alanine ligase [Bacteroidales bacterium]
MKKNIALLLGGDSAEAVISEQSAGHVLQHLDVALYEVYPITIKGASWTYADHGATIDVDKGDFSITVNGRRIHFDCVVPMIHGTPGEDGRLQAYFELVHVPYTTCGVLASALTFNKHACKTYLNSLGILFPKGKLIRKGEKVDASELCAILGLPCFIKPNNGGSSFGVTKVKSSHELAPALEAAFAEDTDEVLVEEFIEGTEITCGLVKLDGKITVFPITEIVSKKEFFDVEAKYETGMSDEITPARISESLRADCETLSTAIYKCLNCRGIVRIDYIVRDGSLYFLEVNTVPGMSAASSIVPKQIDVMGQISIKELYTNLIDEAIKRVGERLGVEKSRYF